MSLSVWEWLGITWTEFIQRVDYGSCIKCGQTAKSKESCLCTKHTRVYHSWITRMKKKEGQMK